MESQDFQQTEGIVLKVIPFRDYDQILVIFTPDQGVIKVIYKGSRSKKRGVQGLCIPLTKVEVVYREKRGEIFSCQEMTHLSSFGFLRKVLVHLEVACDLLQIIATSQLVGKPAPHLYALLCFYLDKIPQTPNPWTLASSFRLKLLRHEGLVALPFRCGECQQFLEEEAYTDESEGWCEKHRSLTSQLWDENELQQLYCLALSQSYQEICAEEISDHIQNKISRFFETCLRRQFT